MKRIFYLSAMFLGLTLAATGCGKKGGESVGQKLDGKDNIIEDKLTPDGAGENAGKAVDKATGND